MFLADGIFPLVSFSSESEDQFQNLHLPRFFEFSGFSGISESSEPSPDTIPRAV